MDGFNSCTFTGNLTRDGKLGKAGNTDKVEFAIAVNKTIKDEKRVMFLECVIFGKRAAAVAKFLTKGKNVLVSGQLEADKWEKDGVKHERVKLSVSDLVLLGGGTDAKPAAQAEPRAEW